MTQELNDQETEDPEDSDDPTDSAEGAETISEASLDDIAGDDTDDPDALVDDDESDNDLADIRRRIEKLEEEKQLQSDLDYLDEDFDD